MNFLITASNVFSKAKLAHFISSKNQSIEPSAVMLLFNVLTEATDTLQQIADKYENYQLTLVIQKGKEHTLSMSLIDAISGDTININNVAYKKEELDEFILTTPLESRLSFTIGFIDYMGNQSYTRNILPLLCERYSVSSTS